MRPRVSVKAVIIHDHQLAAIEKREEDGLFYSFPGGGQRSGETLIQAVEREVLEETGWTVIVGNLLFIREYIGKNHEFADTDGKTHVVDHLFRCSLADPSVPPHPVAPDRDQTGVVWLAVDQLDGTRFFPRTLIPQIIALSRSDRVAGPVYVGDVN